MNPDLRDTPALVQIAGVDFEPADGERWCRPSFADNVVVVVHPGRRPLRITAHNYHSVDVEEFGAGVAQTGIYGTGTALNALQLVEKWRARRDSNSRPPGS